VTLPRSTVVEPHRLIASAPEADARQGIPRRVLIADDNRDGAETLGMLLQLANHEVHLAHDGPAALELAERLKPDIAVLDIGMPGLTGYEVAERIRAETWGRHMVLIAVTGWGQQSDKRKAHLAGFDHHLTKPMNAIDLEQLFAAANPNTS
jgi:CheY-like chemotaxis protein